MLWVSFFQRSGLSAKALLPFSCLDCLMLRLAGLQPLRPAGRRHHDTTVTHIQSAHMFLPLDFLQTWYQDRTWHQDPVVCALGAPALGVDLAGPNLLIRGACASPAEVNAVRLLAVSLWAAKACERVSICIFAGIEFRYRFTSRPAAPTRMFTLHSDRIVSEALTPRIPLVQLSARQPRQLQLLAATLGGYLVAAWALAERVGAAAGSDLTQADKIKVQAQEVLDALAQVGTDFKAALDRSEVTWQQVQEAARWRIAAAPSLTQAAPLLPCPLLGGLATNSLGGKLKQLRFHETQLLYTVTGAEGRSQFIKFTTHPYPKHVSHGWLCNGARGIIASTLAAGIDWGVGILAGLACTNNSDGMWAFARMDVHW